MIIKPSTLSLITMYQCTAACEHCCFSCSPKVTERLPTKRMADFICQAKQFETIKVVVFTGGECFLLGNDLNYLVELAKTEGYTTRVVTNGYWAVSEQVAFNKLKILRESGLDEINLSTGYYHQKYVSLQSIANGISASIELGMQGAIMVEAVLDPEETIDWLMESQKIATAVQSGFVRILVSPWMPFQNEKRV